MRVLLHSSPPLVALQDGAAPTGAGLEWEGIGLLLGLVGCFLLANGVLLRHPRALIEQHFGARQLPLRSLRDLLFHRVQTALGFAFLIAGFALQLWGHADGGSVPGSTALWVGGVVIAALALEIGAWWLSLATFRRHVRRYLREHPPEFEADMALAREVGELYGVRSSGDDTVQSYLERLRARLGLERPARATRPRPQAQDLDEGSALEDADAPLGSTPGASARRT